ncbi:hypothetical protein HIM_10732 [Hirsutella minnesotensis 3608]|uniref:Uncharacterized protein n=1 Tax=Hirsutella minnesotensis 3608 TaxID=1043627 RepID=A0A0F7ZX04_9HYPO|nr:hypothetical protein HIM_10732 [Hirsutella minnesotensis 3608]
MLFIQAFLALLGFTILAAGYSIPGGHERVMFYYAYLMDQPQYGGKGQTIAPQCKNCDLNQFLEKTAKSSPGNVKVTDVRFPEVPPPSTATEIVDKNLAGAVNPGAIYNGATSYDNLLQKVGNFIDGKMASGVPQELKDNARNSIKSVFQARSEAALTTFKEAYGENSKDASKRLTVVEKEYKIFEGAGPEDTYKGPDLKETARRSGKTSSEVKELWVKHTSGGHTDNIKTLRDLLIKVNCVGGAKAKRAEQCLSLAPDVPEEQADKEPGKKAPDEEKNKQNGQPEEEKPGREKTPKEPTKEPVSEVEPGAVGPGKEIAEARLPLKATLVKGISLLQLLQLVTNIVNAAAARIQAVQGDSHLSGLEKVGSVLVGVINDTMPGAKEIEDRTAKLYGDIKGIKADMPVGEKAALIATLMRVYNDDVELIIFENYFPGVPEIINNYRKELAEYKSLKGNMSTAERNAKIAWLITKGTLNTINDVARDWVPGVREAEDSVREEVARIKTMAEDPKTDFWSVAGEVLRSPFKIAVEAVHSFAKHYGPGVELVEKLAIDGPDGKRPPTKDKDSPPPDTDNEIPDSVEPVDLQPPAGLSKSGLEQWGLFLNNELDPEEAAQCVQGKVAEENKKQVKHGKDAWRSKLPQLSKQCYEELFRVFYGKGTDTGKRSLVARTVISY